MPGERQILHIDMDAPLSASECGDDRIDLSRPIRLTGVSLADLRTESTAATLFDEPIRARRRRLEQVAAKIADRFGARGIRRAALLEKE